MTINWTRGFRRIGWVATFPLAAFIILMFHDETKEFAGYDHDLISSKYAAINPNKCDETINEWKKDGHLTIIPGSKHYQVAIVSDAMREIYKYTTANGALTTNPRECLSTEKIIALLKKEKAGDTSRADDLSTWRLHNAFPNAYEVETQRFNKPKLAGLIAGSFVAVALLIQTSISLLAWIMRGFKGTSHIDVS
jgi:hypothetical protein